MVVSVVGKCVMVGKWRGEGRGVVVKGRMRMEVLRWVWGVGG